MKKCIYILSLLAVVSCKKEQLNDCVTSTGEDKTVVRELDQFDEIDITSKFKLVLKQDLSKPESVSITAGSNLIEGIKTEIVDGVLSIENMNTCNFVRTYKRDISLHLNVHTLRSLSVKSAVNVKSEDTLYVENLQIFHTALEDISLVLNASNEVYIQSLNSGGTTLRGKAKVLKGSIEEVSNLDARDFICEEVLIDSHTPLDMYVYASRLLFVKIYAAGNIYYGVEPTDLKEVNINSGSGMLLKQ